MAFQLGTFQSDAFNLQLVAYVIATDGGSYALTGTAATLRDDKLVSAGTVTYSISGTAADTRRTRLMPMAVGTYIVTGTNAALFRIGTNDVVIADAGSYTVTGTPATVIKKFSLSTVGSAYALSGIAAQVRRAAAIRPAISGSYAITGIAATLKWPKYIAASSTIFSDELFIDFVADRFVTNAYPDGYPATTYNIFGTSARAAKLRTLNASPFTEAEANSSVLFLDFTADRYDMAVRSTEARPDTYRIVGSTVTTRLYRSAFDFTAFQFGTFQMDDRIFTTEAGSYGVVGTPATLFWRTLRFPATGGNYALIGGSISFIYKHGFTANSGSYGVTGSLVSIRKPRKTGYIWIWDGIEWREKPVKVWTGTVWVTKPVKIKRPGAWEVL